MDEYKRTPILDKRIVEGWKSIFNRDLIPYLFLLGDKRTDQIVRTLSHVQYELCAYMGQSRAISRSEPQRQQTYYNMQFEYDNKGLPYNKDSE
eukprot:2673523-Karenia_brevis.AAC.1